MFSFTAFSFQRIGCVIALRPAIDPPTAAPIDATKPPPTSIPREVTQKLGSTTAAMKQGMLQMSGTYHTLAGSRLQIIKQAMAMRIS
jgi:hypothetical protein